MLPCCLELANGEMKRKKVKREKRSVNSINLHSGDPSAITNSPALNVDDSPSFIAGRFFAWTRTVAKSLD